MNFWDTKAGHDFTTYTIPMLVKTIDEAIESQKKQAEVMERHTKALERQTEVMERYMAMLEKQAKANTEAAGGTTKPITNNANQLPSDNIV